MEMICSADSDSVFLLNEEEDVWADILLPRKMFHTFGVVCVELLDILVVESPGWELDMEEVRLEIQE